MAYANLVSQFCTNNSEVFKRFRDFLCRRNGSYDYSLTGIGWTLHDAVYATDEDNVSFGDYFVAYSPGESGKEDIYVKVTYASGFINCHVYLHWNASTHIGVTAAGTANNWTNTNSLNATLWVYGDLDSVVCIGKYAYYYGVIFGHCPGSQFATEVAISSGTVSSGSNVVVTVDAVPAGWAVGRKIFIRDQVNVEIVTIADITGTSITLSSVAVNYLAGCKLQGDVTYMHSGTNGLIASASLITSHSGSKSVSHTLEPYALPSAVTADGLSGGAALIPIYFSTSTSLIGPVKNMQLRSNSGATAEQTDIDNDGNTYRWFNIFSNKYVSILEV